MKHRWMAVLLALVGPAAQAQDTPQSQPDSAVTPVVAVEPLTLREDFEAALQEAQKEHKRVALFFRADWSPWSVAMERRVLPDPRVIAGLRGLILVFVDAGRFPEVGERFGVVDFPTLVLLDSDGVEADRVSGYAGSAELAERVANWPSAGKRTPVASLTDAQKAGVDALYAWMAGSRLRGELEQAGDAAKRIVEMDAENASGRADNALAFLGLLESRLGRWDRAYAVYSRMAELYPSTELRSHLLVSLGTAAAMNSRKREAIAAFEQFLKEFPRHPDAAYVRTEIQRLRRLSAQGLGG
jgi:tetratricopeptide (TPR) repeat protein